MNGFHQRDDLGWRLLVFVCLVGLICISLAGHAHAGIRAPGKYSGVVIFDKWGGCILFSGVYLMYVSETVSDQLRPYEGQAIELDALEVVQPMNPGDGLIRKLKVLGPAPPSTRPFTFDGINLYAQLVTVKGSRAAIELNVTNDVATPAKIDSAEIGFVLLSEKIAGTLTPSDGPSTAVIRRSDVFTGRGGAELRIRGKIRSFSYMIPDGLRFPQSFALAPHASRSTQLHFELPTGHYQFFAGYGGGVHESKLNVSNPVSIDIW